MRCDTPSFFVAHCTKHITELNAYDELKSARASAFGRQSTTKSFGYRSTVK